MANRWKRQILIDGLVLVGIIAGTIGVWMACTQNRTANASSIPRVTQSVQSAVHVVPVVSLPDAYWHLTLGPITSTGLSDGAVLTAWFNNTTELDQCIVRQNTCGPLFFSLPKSMATPPSGSYTLQLCANGAFPSTMEQPNCIRVMFIPQVTVQNR